MKYPETINAPDERYQCGQKLKGVYRSGENILIQKMS